ncbi:Gfo/Idh/MocA family protein [Gimesia fumaroli]|uniref:Glucose--fructose oxidoreductase n=1 Tax=Gimesia fumaroli TaxID=2527976 RepID=A0A518IIB2_9PLAN|nr:Gfo/Idh/MocA family oxidoreductase [Gimesia fumaroli]QDV52827.1 Glucose--fructose oxidoreductase precursor [Gimesia fumaroli]
MTNQPLRIGILGLIHDHVWDHLPQLQHSQNAELVAAFDSNQALRDRISAEYDCPTYATPDELFAQHELDGVYIFSSNKQGSELALTAINRGIPVMIEKPMAANLAQAEAMQTAARDKNVSLMVNWPFAWWPQMQHAITMAQAGEIGEIWQVKYRAAHAGPKELGCSDYFCDWLFDSELNGAGAMMDYCCYGCVLSSVLLGMPETITGIAGVYRQEPLGVEDNALIVMQYPNAIATAEGSWSQIGKLTAYATAIYGTKGTLIVEPQKKGRLMLATEDQPQGEEVKVQCPLLYLQTATEHFAHCVRTGEAPWGLCSPETSLEAQRILEAGVQQIN